MNICVCVCVCVYMCICIQIYIYMYVYIYIYIYVYIYGLYLSWRHIGKSLDRSFHISHRKLDRGLEVEGFDQGRLLEDGRVAHGANLAGRGVKRSTGRTHTHTYRQRTTPPTPTHTHTTRTTPQTPKRTHPTNT